MKLMHLLIQNTIYCIASNIITSKTNTTILTTLIFPIGRIILRKLEFLILI